jgi:hypothetical protein
MRCAGAAFEVMDDVHAIKGPARIADGLRPNR